MTRKRIKHQQIANENKRNNTFRKRADGLLKKANELSILCGVEIGVIVHKQDGENNAILWPSPPIVKDRVDKFLNFSTLERNRKMVTGVKLLEQRMATEIDILSKSKKSIEEMEAQKLMNEVAQGKSLNELGLYELTSLNSFTDDMLKKLEKRANEFNEQAMVFISPASTSAMVAMAQQNNIGGAGPSSAWDVPRYK